MWLKRRRRADSFTECVCMHACVRVCVCAMCVLLQLPQTVTYSTFIPNSCSRHFTEVMQKRVGQSLTVSVCQQWSTAVVLVSTGQTQVVALGGEPGCPNREFSPHIITGGYGIPWSGVISLSLNLLCGSSIFSHLIKWVLMILSCVNDLIC